MKHKPSISNDAEIIRELRDDPEFAAEYLNAAIEDAQEPAILLMALRHLSEARGGLARVAKKAGIERESLYRVLSAKGNPRLSTLAAVLNALGMTMRLEPARASRKSSADPNPVLSVISVCSCSNLLFRRSACFHSVRRLRRCFVTSW